MFEPVKAVEFEGTVKEFQWTRIRTVGCSF